MHVTDAGDPHATMHIDREQHRSRSSQVNPVALRYAESTGMHIAPTSMSQRALWVLVQMMPDEPVYNETNVFRLKGPLDVDALTNAVNEIVRRHGSLRTTFATVDGEPVQVIAPTLQLTLALDDLGSLPDREREPIARQRVSDEVRVGFDLERGPLTRVRLLRLASDEHWLMITMHHIIRDGTSNVIMAQELSVLYAAFSSGKPSPLPALPVQFADFAVSQREWLRSESMQDQLAYWKKVLARLPALQLPTDRPRPPVASYRGGRLVFALDEDLVRRLRELGQRENASLYTTLLAAFQVLLYRYTGEEDIAVGVAVAGRRRPELQGLIGYFVNMLVVRGDLSGEPTFVEYLARLRERAAAAYAHQDLPFATLVEELAPRRDPSRNPLFQVSFIKGTEPRERPELAGLVVEDVEYAEAKGSDTVKFDLDFSIAEEHRRITVTVEYATDLFDAATIERMIGHWRVLLEAIVADPQQRISRLPLLTDAERRQLLRNDAVVEYPRDRCLHQLFEAQVQRTPEAIAVVCEGEKLTYDELNARANRLAHHLRTLGVGPEVLVAIAMERSLDLVVALLGILKAGGAYVPLDPSYPAARLAFMLADTQAPVLLTQRRLLQQLPVYSGHAICVDQDWPDIAAQPDTNPEPRATTDNLAYVIYTSGSTGQPKGVMVEHRSVVNYVSWIGRTFPLTVSDRVLQKTSITFDASVEEIFFPLTCGASLVVAGPYVHRSVDDMAKLLEAHRITVLQVVPSLLAAMLDTGALRRCDALRLLLCGAEVLTPELVRRTRDECKAELVNLYGPTETTISSTFWTSRSQDPGHRIPIGTPIANTHAVVVDGAGQPVPIGVAGELCISGAGVARGYLDRPDLTAQCFAADPFALETNARRYKTGDLVRRLPDGNLEFLGRRDAQLKLRGYRIEAGEIETILTQHEAVQHAVVFAREDRPGDKRLVAYVVSASGRSSTRGELQAFLAAKLPEYMVPTAFVFVKALPVGASGKVDREQLPAPDRESFAAEEAHQVSPRDPIEAQLASIFAEVLGMERIGVHADFFEFGGDSLLAVQLLSRVRSVFGTSVSIPSFFSGATVARVAQQVRAQGTSGTEADRASSAIRSNPRVPVSRASTRYSS